MRAPAVLLASVFLFALSACGQNPPPTAPAPLAQPGEVTLGVTKNMPDWLLIAHASDGGDVHFNQRAMVRNADGTADIWIQIRHGAPQLYGVTGGNVETTVRYNVERLHYRFRCGQGQFVILERQFMGPNDAVAAEDHPRTDLWRPIPSTGIAQISEPIACRGR